MRFRRRTTSRTCWLAWVPREPPQTTLAGADASFTGVAGAARLDGGGHPIPAWAAMTTTLALLLADCKTALTTARLHYEWEHKATQGRAKTEHLAVKARELCGRIERALETDSLRQSAE